MDRKHNNSAAIVIPYHFCSLTLSFNNGYNFQLSRFSFLSTYNDVKIINLKKTKIIYLNTFVFISHQTSGASIYINLPLFSRSLACWFKVRGSLSSTPSSFGIRSASSFHSFPDCGAFPLKCSFNIFTNIRLWFFSFHRALGIH